MKTLHVNDRGNTRYVPDFDDDDTQSTALARPVDVEGITRDAIGANSAMVANLLKQFAPTIDAPGYRQPQQSGIASPAELAARNQRFRWTVIALIVLSAIATAGIVLVAVVTGNMTPALGVSAWIALTGISAMLATWHVHRTELAHSPEALEMERIKSDYDISSVDAASRQMIAKAFSKSIKNDSETKRANAEAQRAANLSLLERSKPVSAPQRARATVYDESYQDDYEQPVCAPVAPSVATWELAQEPELQPIAPAQPDPVLMAMLQAIGELYADCERRDSDTITTRLPWSARGDWTARDKERAQAVLSTIDLIVQGEGGRYRLNRAWRREVAERYIAREWR